MGHHIYIYKYSPHTPPFCSAVMSQQFSQVKPFSGPDTQTEIPVTWITRKARRTMADRMGSTAEDFIQESQLLPDFELSQQPVPEADEETKDTAEDEESGKDGQGGGNTNIPPLAVQNKRAAKADSVNDQSTLGQASLSAGVLPSSKP